MGFREKYVSLFEQLAERFYNTDSYIDEIDATGSYGGVSLYDQSYGESFLALVRNRFPRNGLYLLDEPEAALSSILLARPGAEILFFAESDIVPVDIRGHGALSGDQSVFGQSTKDVAVIATGVGKRVAKVENV